MAKQIPIGARAEAKETVEFEHTLTSHHPELPPVYSTPDMIRLMEMRCSLIVKATRSPSGPPSTSNIAPPAASARASKPRPY